MNIDLTTRSWAGTSALYRRLEATDHDLEISILIGSATIIRFFFDDDDDDDDDEPSILAFTLDGDSIRADALKEASSDVARILVYEAIHKAMAAKMPAVLKDVRALILGAHKAGLEAGKLIRSGEICRLLGV